MNQEQLPHMKERIRSELASVNAKIAELKKTEKPEELESGGDNTPLSEEADAAAVVEEKELETSVLSTLLDRAAALDQALKRIAEGTYGICVDCSKPIALERLEAVPEAIRCEACQEAYERGQEPAEPCPTEWKEVEKTYDELKEYES